MIFSRIQVTNVLQYIFTGHAMRGLYERHRLLFLLQLSLRIDLGSKRIHPREVQFLLHAGANIRTDLLKIKDKAWVPDQVWINLCQLALIQVKNFSSFVSCRSITNKVTGVFRHFRESSQGRAAVATMV